MKLITSKDNDLIKHIRALDDKKTRKNSSEFAVEGTKWIYDALKVKGIECVNVLLKQSKKNEFLPHLESVLEKVILVEDNVFEKIETTTNGQGIIATFKTNFKLGTPKGEKVLFLDHISDPGNLGTIIRTACGAGYNDIILHNCTDPHSPKSARASMSAIVKVNLFDGGIELLKDLSKTHKIIGADINGKTILGKMDKISKKCLVIGNEAHGMSDTVKKICHEFVSIPMKNIESLNAAVSAGILMYFFNSEL
ncbi:MAG: RNA methyltransferase [Firmicutes bacterium]|nr:RNA methyltransferase [Bacillota bacterium]